MKHSVRWTLLLPVVGLVAATGALAETSPADHQMRWEKCYRSCETTYGTNESGTGKGFKACVARCEDKWLSTMDRQQQRPK